MLVEIYENLEDYNKAIDILNRILGINPNDKNAKEEMDKLKGLINPQK
jgi:tetratricopeptide (TPR) repeat protein